MTPAREILPRFFGLDALRGIAALGVVFWHWQHFFTAQGQPRFDHTRAPLGESLALFYRHGELAVDLFFCLSGFIFFWMYAQRVATLELSAGRFAWLRFSRLYPLHLATLLIVAAGQWWLAGVNAEAFVYEDNDARHFALNLLFASSWGLENGYSYNGPAWSISVEVFLYALFFAFCRLLPIRMWSVLCTSLAGFVIAASGYAPLGRGIGSFFLGGAVFLAYQWLAASSDRRRFAAVAAALAVLAWAATLGWPLGELKGTWRRLPTAWSLFVLFPLSILSLALLEQYTAPVTRRVAWLGDISYSVYLLHFPLQLGFVAVAGRFLDDTSIYYSHGFMAGFFAILLACAAASHHYFEMPAQELLRGIGKLPPRVMRKPVGASSIKSIGNT